MTVKPDIPNLVNEPDRYGNDRLYIRVKVGRRVRRERIKETPGTPEFLSACADALVDVESARSVAYHAAWAAVHDRADLELTASFAAAYCAEAFTRVAATNIQVHGGLGFTWEHSAHLYFKRAHTGAELLGSTHEHYNRVAEHLAEI